MFDMKSRYDWNDTVRPEGPELLFYRISQFKSCHTSIYSNYAACLQLPYHDPES